MKQVIIEKTIELDHVYDRIDELTCQKHAVTTALAEGLQCTGSIEITGTGILGEHSVPVKESIDLSIFAPFSKMDEQEQFEVQMNQTQLSLNGQMLHCTFEFDVYGVVEKVEENNEASIDDLLDDSTVIHEKVRYGLTYPEDTYFTIASRYQVDESEVRRLNQDKNLSGRMLILLPCG